MTLKHSLKYSASHQAASAIAAACLIAMTGISLPAGAQNLQQEITVEHEIVPVKREAFKRSITPAISLSPITKGSLEVISRGVGIELDPVAAVMHPVASEAIAPDTVHHGYASIGYFPTYNLGASAGYSGRSRNLSGGGWLQFNGRSYSRTNPLTGFDSDYRRNTATVGAYADVVTKAGTLGARLTYTGDWYRTPVWTENDSELKLGNQAADNFNLDLSFVSPTRPNGGIEWHAGAGFGLFGYGESGSWSSVLTDQSLLSRVKESLVKVKGGASMRFSDITRIGIDAEFDYQRDNRRSSADFDFRTLTYQLSGTDNGYSIKLLSLRPHWEITAAAFSARIGALIQFTGNSGKTFHIAPDVMAAWTPSAMFAIYGKAGGGEHLNTLESLHNAAPFTASPMMGYNASHLPLTLEAGLRVGPWKGLSFRAYGRYAAANEWLMPVELTEGVTGFRPLDMRGSLVGAEIEWTAGRTGSLRASFECSPENKLERGWYAWLDRTRRKVEIEGSVRPISPLGIHASWQLRDGRKIYDRQTLVTLTETIDHLTEQKLGTVSDLSIGADWTLNQTFNIWVHFENILSRKWQHIGYIPSQGFHGLAGVSCKF